MNREIKFRAFDGKEMHQNVCINHEGKAIKYGYRATDWVEDANAGTPMQFTGLYDANGDEVYEGDIIFNDDRKENAVVKWSEEKAMFITEYVETKDSFPLWQSISNCYCIVE